MRTLQHADLSPKAAREVAKRLAELAEQADKGEIIRLQIAEGGSAGSRGRHVVAELREESEEQ